MNRSTTTFALGGGRKPAQVIPFAPAAQRRFRRDAQAEMPRGQILLFTGVRYERMPEARAEAPAPQRKRS